MLVVVVCLGHVPVGVGHGGAVALVVVGEALCRAIGADHANQAAVLVERTGGHAADRIHDLDYLTGRVQIVQGDGPVAIGDPRQRGRARYSSRRLAEAVVARGTNTAANLVVLEEEARPHRVGLDGQRPAASYS